MDKKIPDVVALGHHGNGGNKARVHHIPVAGETITAWDFKVLKDGGKAAHQAIVVGRLGGSAAFIGKKGTGEPDTRAISWLEENNVDTHHIIRQECGQTHPGLILVDDNGSNTIIMMEGVSQTLTFDEVRPHLEAFKGAKIFVTGFEIPVDTALKSAKLAKELGMMTVLNPSPISDKIDERLDYIDILIPNELEANMMAGVKGHSGHKTEKVAKKIKEQYGINNIIITLGGNGVFYYDGQKGVTVDGMSVEVINTTGAGDCFTGTLLWAINEGKTIVEAIRIGNIAAAYSVTHDGTIDSFPTLKQMNLFMENCK